MDYNKSKARFEAYVQQCKQEIIRQFFPSEETLINQNKLILDNTSIGIILTPEEKKRKKDI